MSRPHDHEISEHSEQSSEQRLVQEHEYRLEKARDIDEQRDLAASRDMRAEIVEREVRREMPDTAEKRLTSAKDFHYLSDNDFDRELKRRDSRQTNDDINCTQGFFDPFDHQAFVRDRGNTYETSLHEKYHQKSHTDMPIHMNEGMTEYLARERAGGIGRLRDIDHRGRDVTPPPAYENEVVAVRKMAATVGDDRIESAYFEGKTDDLRKEFDAIQGDGAYERLQKAVERGDKQAADRVFEKK